MSDSRVPVPERLMARALRLAERGGPTTHPNPRVGCVIVRDGEVIGEGWHERAGEPHAEVHALRAAGERARGGELFVTLEPCSHHGRTPPCADAVIAAGVRKVWVAMHDPNPQVAGQGIARLRAAGIEVVEGLMEREARALNRGFVSRMTRQRPWVTLKLAASLDGRTAMASGESRWITGAEARADVQRLRARAGAVLTGVGTVLADDPQLNCRESAIGDRQSFSRQPDRIVLDSDARVPAQAKVWNPGARRFWVTAQPGSAPHGVQRLTVPRSASGLALDGVLAALAGHEVNEVLVECGARLAGAFLQQRLVDELILYLAPCLLGDDGRALAQLAGIDRLDQRLRLEWLDLRRVGPDLRITARPVEES
ncbi:bifunctional diaminohydroxyphosphoribosylaminopyrimidine deaminase/5-amino-6-(5-phosphoribosylamino)uracil reductase RibD [Fontimonas sp. SYSU GA230001]|uniref:bifunctional diaminohydroxyphosphoribosylaminopyrimidine deaminase/5-amino-6-(5-phosphoribosylamino)uracil reductase RibD n=1 Tax=Fontimonas sp. SYSU GA230001 TaxID=3142450 RepID=UPI0032B52428